MRFRVGESCEHNAVSWINVTGGNSEPGIGSDWLKKEVVHKREFKLISVATYTLVLEDKNKILFLNQAVNEVIIPPDVFSAKDKIIAFANESNSSPLFTAGTGAVLAVPKGSTNRVKSLGKIEFLFSGNNGGQLTGDLVENAIAGPRPEKRISNTTQYTAVAEDAKKYLVFENPVELIINTGVFAKNDELEGDCEGGDVSITAGTGLSLLYLETQRPIILNKGPFGMRFKSGTKASLFGALKPL